MGTGSMTSHEPYSERCEANRAVHTTFVLSVDRMPAIGSMYCSVEGRCQAAARLVRGHAPGTCTVGGEGAGVYCMDVFITDRPQARMDQVTVGWIRFLGPPSKRLSSFVTDVTVSRSLTSDPISVSEVGYVRVRCERCTCGALGVRCEV